jgi:predicted oxidoreductase
MKNRYSKIIAGCMSWGNWGKQFSKEEMIKQMNLTLDAGITTFDHADIYGDYTTEYQFGKAFVESGIQREEVQLISKCGIQYVGDTRANTIKHYNYSKEYIIWSVETSLKALQTDYLDLLLLHRPSPLMEPDEISEAIQHLKEQGKILDFGVSNFTPSQVDLLSNKVAISVNQIEFSLTQHNAMHNGTLDQMLQKQIIPMCWSPLGNAFKEKTATNDRVHELLAQLAEKYTATKDQLLLAWILQHPAKIHPVIGTTNSERITNAVKATEIALELEDWFSLLVAHQGHKVP